MSQILLALMVALLLTLLGGLVRVVRGPTDADRMLAAQLLGTTTVALLMLMSVATSTPRLLDVALVFAILAAIAVVCFVATGEGQDHDAA